MNDSLHTTLQLQTVPTAEERRELRNARLRRGLQMADLCFYLVYCLIGLQIILEALGARDSAGFKRFLDILSWPFLAPFRGLLNDPHVQNYQLMGSFVFALVAYLLLQSLIHKIVHVVTGVRAPG